MSTRNISNLVVKSKLPPRSGSSLEAVEPHPLKRDHKVFSLFQETNLYSNRLKRNETINKKIRLAKSRTSYYANTVMTLRLIFSGDIPGNKQKSRTCSTWNKTVRCNTKKT